MADRRRVAVLASGRGSNMAALIYAARADSCPFEIAIVTGDRPDAPALALAEAEGVAVAKLDSKQLGENYWAALQMTLEAASVEFIALAGFMRIIPTHFLDRWEGRMVNIHPSLLPHHKGLSTHQAVLAAGGPTTGATVHLVTAALDDGPILGQVEVAVMPGDTAENLSDRVLIAEHQLYPRVLAEFVGRDQSPEWLLQRVRGIASALPEVTEKPSHGSPAFFVNGGKAFAYFSANHHGEGRIAVLTKITGPDEQQMLVEQDGDRFFRPAYFGDNWVGIRVDLPGTDWEQVANRIEQSWEMAAPRRLLTVLSRC